MRKKKSLLSEAQVRRFQTLATIRPLHEMESFIKEEEMDAGDAEMEMDAEEAPAEEAPAEEPAEADVELDEELVAKFAEAVATMQEVSDILSGGAPEEDLAGEEMEMGAEEEPMDMDAEEAPPAEEEAPAEEEEEEMLQEALKGIKYVPSQKEVIKVVAQRVAKRLQEAKHAQRKLNRALGKRK